MVRSFGVLVIAFNSIHGIILGLMDIGFHATKTLDFFMNNDDSIDCLIVFAKGENRALPPLICILSSSNYHNYGCLFMLVILSMVS